MPPYGPAPQTGTVDRELAEQAMERANRESNEEWDVVPFLCRVCNRPYFGEDPNPNDFVIDEDDGPYGNDKSAFQISPQAILDRDPENAWDCICVAPRVVEYDHGDQLQVEYFRHEFSSEGYQAWAEQMKYIQTTERRKEENQGLDEFAEGE